MLLKKLKNTRQNLLDAKDHCKWLLDVFDKDLDEIIDFSQSARSNDQCACQEQRKNQESQPKTELHDFSGVFEDEFKCCHARIFVA